MVFQQSGLFPWLTAIKNIEFGPKNAGMAKAERRKLALSLIELVHLEGSEEKYPKELSGGMQQRVAIARALATNPEILLMDEPFGALDQLTRENMQRELLRIWESHKTTVVFVTHGIMEAIFLSDRVLVLGTNPGHIKQIFHIDLPRPRQPSSPASWNTMTRFITPFFSRTPEGGWVMSDLSIKIVTIAVLLGAWEAASDLGYLKVYLFSNPSKLAETFVMLLTKGFPGGITVMVHIKATFFRIVMGFVLACLVAIPLGLFIGRTRWLERMVDPIVTFARSIATISLLPLAIAWFGVGELARVLLIFYGCFWIVLTNTIQGSKYVDTVLINAGHVLGARGWRLFFQVILPASLPRIFAGMKVALGMAFMVIIAVEMIGTIKGLGALIQQARTFYNTSIAIDGMIFIALIGLLISYTLDWLERLLLPWNVVSTDNKDG